MAAKQPLSFKKITDAIDAVEASVQAASAGTADAGAKKEALRFLEDLRGQSHGVLRGPKGRSRSPRAPSSFRTAASEARARGSTERGIAALPAQRLAVRLLGGRRDPGARVHRAA